MNDDELSPDGPPVKPDVFLTVIHTLAWFFLDWRYSRVWMDLVGGLPAILVGGAAWPSC